MRASSLPSNWRAASGALQAISRDVLGFLRQLAQLRFSYSELAALRRLLHDTCLNQQVDDLPAPAIVRGGCRHSNSRHLCQARLEGAGLPDSQTHDSNSQPRSHSSNQSRTREHDEGWSQRRDIKQ